MKNNINILDWDTKVYDIGSVTEYTTHEFEFKYFGEKVINKVSASCGCTSAKSDDNNVIGSINTKAGSKLNDFKLLNKTITVYFTDKTEDKLSIQGKVYNKGIDLNSL